MEKAARGGPFVQRMTLLLSRLRARRMIVTATTATADRQAHRDRGTDAECDELGVARHRNRARMANRRLRGNRVFAALHLDRATVVEGDGRLAIDGVDRLASVGAQALVDRDRSAVQ